MRDLELQVDTLMRLCTAETLTEQTRVKQELRQLMAYPQLTRKDPPVWSGASATSSR